MSGCPRKWRNGEEILNEIIQDYFLEQKSLSFNTGRTHPIHSGMDEWAHIKAHHCVILKHWGKNRRIFRLPGIKKERKTERGHIKLVVGCFQSSQQQF